MPGSRKTHPETFVDCETIQDSIARAQAARSVAHAWIGGRAYRVYPERYERWSHEDKILLAEAQKIEPQKPRSTRRKASQTSPMQNMSRLAKEVPMDFEELQALLRKMSDAESTTFGEWVHTRFIPGPTTTAASLTWRRSRFSSETLATGGGNARYKPVLEFDFAMIRVLAADLCAEHGPSKMSWIREG